MLAMVSRATRLFSKNALSLTSIASKLAPTGVLNRRSGLCGRQIQTATLRSVAMNAAAPMNRPAKVRFMRLCCLGVRNIRSTLDASPV